MVLCLSFNFLNSFSAEDMSTPNVKEGLQAAGSNSILPKEHGSKFYSLPFVKMFDKDVSLQMILLLLFFFTQQH